DNKGARPRSHRLRHHESRSILQEARGCRHQTGSSVYEERADRGRARVHLRSVGNVYRAERTAESSLTPLQRAERPLNTAYRPGTASSVTGVESARPPMTA